jgi:DNA-binding protein H-NS
MTDALAEIRSTEATIRTTEAEVREELADLKRKVDTAVVDDQRAYASALAAGAAVPKPTSAKMKDRIRDIEQRLLPGTDAALWLLVDDVVLEIKPPVDPRILRKNLLRWNPPDAGLRDRPAPTRHLAHRPADVVKWVLGRIAAVETLEVRQRRRADDEALHRDAERRVNAAQAEYVRKESIAYEESLNAMSVTAANAARLKDSKSPTAPWIPFDRKAFLDREGLTAAYNWVQGGQHIEVRGKPEAVAAMHAGPARELAPDTGPNSTPA